MRHTVKHAIGVLGVLALVWGGFVLKSWTDVGASEDFTQARAREFTLHALGRYGFALTAEDEVEAAWQDQHWLDAKTRVRLRLSPERAAVLRRTLLAADGSEWSGWTTAVTHAAPGCSPDLVRCPGQALSTGERLPAWWKTDGLRELEELQVVTRYARGGGVHGINLVLSAPDGIVLLEAWRT